ncbi:hypothetical protein CLOM_g20974 [Closterium sp. NIES-68]|nr:hypothetical protein CLOM_g20974 [Closterium sp. NIES-68]
MAVAHAHILPAACAAGALGRAGSSQSTPGSSTDPCPGANQCPGKKGCFSSGDYCDGVKNCADGSDEWPWICNFEMDCGALNASHVLCPDSPSVCILPGSSATGKPTAQMRWTRSLSSARISPARGTVYGAPG